jgi:Type IV secretion-system coupling protein DNA-binding domain
VSNVTDLGGSAGQADIQQPVRVSLLEGMRVGPTPPVAGASFHGQVMRAVLQGHAGAVRYDDEYLSRHLLFLGGIGTGKTNAMMQLVLALRERADPDDVFVVFDTKGDFLRESSRPGDAVIASDPDAVAGGVVWNLFQEMIDEDIGTRSDQIYEIASTVFSEDLSRASQNFFFAAAARDIFAAVAEAMSRQEGHQYSNADLRSQLERSHKDLWDEEMQVEAQELAAHEQWVKAPEVEGPDVGAVVEQKEKGEELAEETEKVARAEDARDNASVETRDPPTQTPEHVLQVTEAKQQYDSALSASNAAQRDLAAARERVQVTQAEQNQIAHAPASDSAMAAARLATAQARGGVWVARLQADTAGANLRAAEQRLTGLGEPVTGTQTTQSATSSAAPDATSSTAPSVTWGAAPGATWGLVQGGQPTPGVGTETGTSLETGTYTVPGATWSVVPDGGPAAGAGTPAGEHGPAAEAGPAPETGPSTGPDVS